MKNILIVASSLYVGGAERVVANLAKHLDPERFRVIICHLKQKGQIGEELHRQGYKVIGVPRQEESIRRYFSFLGLRKIVRENNIQLLHSHTTYALVDSSLCRMTMRGVKTVHTFHFGNYPNYDRKYMIMETLFSKFSDCLVAVGEEQRGVIRNVYNYSEKRIMAILNGVEDIVAAPDPEWEARIRSEKRTVIGTISTHIEQKGLTYLLDTAQELRTRGLEPLFVVVGDGPLRPGLEEKCKKMGLSENIVFTGWKHSAGSTMMPLFDIFFQPSLWEAMSMVVLEAMAAKKPVVVTDVGDNRHVVAHEKTGFVVPAKDVGQMANALQRLITSRELRDAYGSAGRAKYERSYTVRAMAKQYEDLYDKLLS